MSYVLIAAIPLSFVLAPASAGDAPAKSARDAVKSVSLEEGLRKVRGEYRPAIIFSLGDGSNEGSPEAGEKGGGGKAAASFLADLEAFLADPRTPRSLAGYIWVEVDGKSLAAPYPPARRKPPDREKAGKDRGKKSAPPRRPGAGPPPIGGGEGAPPRPGGEGAEADPPRAAREVLGMVPGEPALVVLDFREKVVRRYTDKLLRREALRRELRALLAAVLRQAAAARKVEKALDDAEYAYAIGETREAVLSVIPLDDPGLQRGLDPVLLERLAARIARWKEDGAAAIAVGTALEADRRYVEAVKAYQDAGLRFPFPEVLKTTARLAANALRRAQGEW